MPQQRSAHVPRVEERRRRRLLAQYAERRNPSDLEALVVSYRPLADALARRYSSPHHDDADLRQAACEGLVKAIRRFDPARGVPFTSFAVPTVLGEVRRHLRDTTWPAHVPRRVQERAQAVRKLTDAAASSGLRAPTVPELAAQLECGEEDVVDALTAVAVRRTVPIDGESDESESAAPADVMGVVDPGYDRVECLAALDVAFPKLAPDEQVAVRLRFAEDLSQRQIAARMGCSRSQVGRLLVSAVDRLRTETAAEAA